MEVVLLNADYSFLNFVNWKKAITLLTKGKVDVVKYSEKEISSAETKMKVPRILRLTYMVKAVFKAKVSFARKLVFLRDGHKCGYCEIRPRLKSEKLTIDHIHPRVHGGKNTYENTVACCVPCNNKKGSMSLAEAKMKLRVVPYTPTVMDILRIKLKNIGFSEKEMFEEIFAEG